MNAGQGNVICCGIEVCAKRNTPIQRMPSILLLLKAQREVSNWYLQCDHFGGQRHGLSKNIKQKLNPILKIKLHFKIKIKN